MGNIAAVLIMIVAVPIAAVAFFRWQERWRVYRVNRWVTKYLMDRYGTLPNHLSISCFEDYLCPVVVRFDHPDTGIRHRMQFSCQGSDSTFYFQSERVEVR